MQNTRNLAQLCCMGHGCWCAIAAGLEQPIWIASGHSTVPGSGSVVIVVMFPGLKRTVQVIFGITLGGGYK